MNQGGMDMVVRGKEVQASESVVRAMEEISLNENEVQVRLGELLKAAVMAALRSLNAGAIYATDSFEMKYPVKTSCVMTPISFNAVLSPEGLTLKLDGEGERA